MDNSWEMRLSELFKECDTVVKEEDDDDGIPMVTNETLKIYSDYLKQQIVFPFAAFNEREIAPFSVQRYDVKVTGIEETFDEEYGLFCSIKIGRKKRYLPLGDLEVDSGAPYYQLVEDYNTWFWNYR